MKGNYGTCHRKCTAKRLQAIKKKYFKARVASFFNSGIHVEEQHRNIHNNTLHTIDLCIICSFSFFNCFGFLVWFGLVLVWFCFGFLLYCCFCFSCQPIFLVVRTNQKTAIFFLLSFCQLKENVRFQFCLLLSSLVFFCLLLSSLVFSVFFCLLCLLFLVRRKYRIESEFGLQNTEKE